MLINEEKLIQVLKSFHLLTGVRIAVVDRWYNEIASYPRDLCAFCSTLRKDEQFLLKCNACDETAFKQVEKDKKQYTYRCHAGLYESVYPIEQENKIVGFLMIGQFVGESDRNEIKRRFVSDEKVANLVDELATFDTSRMRSLAEIMMVCAEYLCFSKTLSPREKGYEQRVKEYVDEHLHEDLSVDTLAKRFGVSRTGIYMLFKRAFGKSVTQYVNYRKIELAKKLLKERVPTEQIMSRINLIDPNYFSRMFVRYAGVSIREYKKSLDVYKN